MDGQIGGEINKPVLNNGMPENSTPASRAKLDEPIAKVCSDVTAKLNLSSSPMKMPGKARTVSSTDSPLQKPPHTFDFRFVTSDD
ncbi:hypothetical protein, partial [Endozoicomonas sp. ISHI1]|uniref:hypothetical protein n=1 Tax=Endozoicomonas sp. ISHI1 TaxID=2825882 RepID=UPI002148E615